MKLSLGPVYSLILSCLLATLEPFLAFGAPVGDINNSIKTPCGGPVTITTANKKTSKETISQLLTLVNEAKSLAGTSKFEMTQAIGSSNMILFLDSLKFFNTINAEEIKVGLDIKKSLGNLFKSNFGNFSELAIYTNVAASDAAANHVLNIKAVLRASYSRVLSRLLVSLQLLGAFSAPVGDINTTIMTPCGGPVTITDANKTTSNETISHLHIHVNEAKSLAGTSTFEMAQAIGNADMVMFLDTLSYFKIINAEEIEAGLDILNGLGNLFKSNFGNFSELAIYTNVVASDAAANHVLNIKAVLDKLWTILCELQIGTLSQGESITQYLNTSIISDEVLLDTSPEEVLFRNYIIMRDVEKNLGQFSLLYKYIKDRL